MNGAHRRYLWLEQGLGGAVFNFFFNVAIAWAFFRGLDRVPLWGLTSIASDTISTCFLLPFMTCLVVTRLARREIERGRFDAPTWRRTSHAILGRLPASTVSRGLLLGILGLGVVLPLTLGALVASGIDALPLREFLIVKASFAGVFGGIVTPIVALAALGDAPLRGTQPAQFQRSHSSR